MCSAGSPAAKTGDTSNTTRSAPEPRPGEMSEQDAADLLDSLAGDEPALPALVEKGKPPDPDDPLRDW